MTVLKGMMSIFGGPSDHGVGPHEGLALVSDIKQFPDLFLPTQPVGTTGLARRLNPDEYYLACRWNYKQTSVEWLRENRVVVTNPKTGQSILAQPVDWGPNIKTGRIADLSPGLASALKLQTDDECEVIFNEADKSIVVAGSGSDMVADAIAKTITPETAPTIVSVSSKIIWPLQSECPQFYGNPASQNWLHENTTDIKCPWTLYMGKEVVPYILIHKKCADSLTRVLNNIWEATGKDINKIHELKYDQYDGSYNPRPIRGSTGGYLSMHAYAAAIDWDAADNEQHAMKHLFQEDSLLVVKFKEEGWIWGGDWSPGSIDAMHVQAARIHS